MEEQRDKVFKCTNCGKELSMGLDVRGSQQGVIGPRGFVPLEDVLIFCSEECLVKYLKPEDNEPWGSKERVP